MEPRIAFARLMMLGALACGVVGLAVGLAERQWRRGVAGWFTGGTLLAVLWWSFSPITTSRPGDRGRRLIAPPPADVVVNTLGR